MTISQLLHAAAIAFVAVALAASPVWAQGPASAALQELSGEAGPAAAERHWIWEFFSYAASEFLWTGAWIAVKVTALSMTIGLILGLGLALMRLSGMFVVRAAAWFYIWIVRGTPQLLQLVFIYDALPYIGLKFDSFTTAVIGFSLNQAAFSAEIIRGGILSVNKAQSTAASALGMGPVLTLRRIVLPQAMRAILPGIGNDTISMLKLTSIASIIFVNELTFRAQQIVGQNFRFFTVFAAAGLIYLLLTSAISIAQGCAEARFDLERERRPRGETLRRMLGFRLNEKRAGERPAPTQTAPATAEAVPQGDDVFLRLATSAGGVAQRGDPFVVCRNVQKSYGGRVVLNGIDMTVARGEVVVLLGPSGSGKSTFLRTINHLESVDWGQITVDGHHVGYARTPGGGLKPTGRLAKARADARIGMVFQHFNLFNHLSALENVIEAPIRVFGMEREAAKTLGLKLLDEVGLTRHADHLPHRLSGGQQQRVAIARALAISPKLMLFDEPTSALDPELVGEVLQVMRKLADASMTMIVVTHEIRFAREVADRVVFIDEGVVVEQGSPSEVIDNPRQERTRRFLRVVERAEAAS